MIARLAPTVPRLLLTLRIAVIASCAYLAARAAGALLVVAPLQHQPASQRLARRPVRQARGSGARLEHIVERNPFCSSCSPPALAAVAGNSSSDPAGEQAETASDEPVKTELDLELVATMTLPGEGEGYAMLRQSSPELQLYSPGQVVGADEATIQGVYERRILLDRAGRIEYLELAVDRDAAKPTARKKRKPKRAPKRRPAALPDEIKNGIRKVGPRKWEIRRGALNAALSNSTLLAKSARIVPQVRKGRPVGFRLYRIRRGSVYDLLGMNNGDVVQAVNGRPMTTPDKALEIYTKLRTASHFTISVRRRGKTITHEYVVR